MKIFREKTCSLQFLDEIKAERIRRGWPTTQGKLVTLYFEEELWVAFWRSNTK